MSLTSARLDELATQPELIAHENVNDLFSLSRSDCEHFQLAALQTRFAQLRDKVPALKKLADGIGAEKISSLAAAAPLLFQHVIYKSYPLALIERGDFVRLNSWLNGLTTHDLSHLDVSHIKCIDDWLQYLDDNTPVRVVHSTGTTGKLSFLPRSMAEMPTYVKTVWAFYAGFRDEPDLTPEPGLCIAIPAYKRGYNSAPRMLQAMKTEWKIADEDTLTLYDLMSADLMSLAGRLRTAEAKGEVGKLSNSPEMQALRNRLAQQNANHQNALETFFERAISQFGGRRVWMMGSVPMIYKAAEAAKARGLSHVFDKRSLVQVGGGLKGEKFPPDFMQTIRDFVGVETIREGYGMTEMITFNGICPQGKFHLPPQLIAYVMDPDTGELMTQKGVQSGRFGYIDLLAQTYWGGFLTGDFVTIDWDHHCLCGRSGGPVLHGKVQRLTEQRGGDDKISCSGGADDAHDRAVKFLLNGS